jgi:hypothetical protein
MITDQARQKLIPSLAEVLATLKKVQPPYFYSPSQIRVPVSDAAAHLTPANGLPSTLQTPVIELRAVRLIDDHGQQSETWSVVSMPEFHL